VDPLADELLRVDFDCTAWILAADLEALQSASVPTGLRLLPPWDSGAQLRDRATIVETRLMDGTCGSQSAAGARCCTTTGPWGGAGPQEAEALPSIAGDRVVRLRGASHAISGSTPGDHRAVAAGASASRA
jgi:hypothetical protein